MGRTGRILLVGLFIVLGLAVLGGIAFALLLAQGMHDAFSVLGAAVPAA